MATKKSYPFEESLARLESLVEKMESGDLSLEQSLATFEEGIKLTRECQQALKDAEQKVRLLIEKSDGVTETPFEAPDHNDE
ncbi:MAG: exodeoxyribonuclease VII small subunit [Pseudomonadales bacterium]|nr:exodeoxyribonuclease VII small subunit [Pseudomonadales bacterium]